MNEQEPSQMTDASELFETTVQKLIPPEWIDFNHPDFPKYFKIAILDENGEIKSWWERTPNTKNTGIL